MRRALTAAASCALAACALAACAERAPAPELPPHLEYLDGPVMLIYAGTGGWRHEDGIAGGNLALLRIAAEAGLAPFTTEDPAHFDPRVLSGVAMVALNNATGLTLDADQRAALEAWMADGGRLLALHGSGDASHADWSWYQDTVVGPGFIGHPMDPQFQTATVTPLVPGHPVMDGLEGGFAHEDEWYSFDALPDGTFLSVAGIAETDYDPVLREGAAASFDPADHPVVWVACEGAGRSVYSALGHSAEAFAAPGHERLLRNAVAWLRADGAAGCPR